MARRGSHETAIVFLENGGDPNDRGGWWNETPLYWAVDHRDVPLAARLFEKGADQSVPIEVNMCPRQLFQLACESGSLEMVKLFVEHGARITGVIGGTSALHGVAQSGNLELVRYLLREGADPCAVDDRGFTPRRLLDVNAKIALANGNRPLEAQYRRTGRFGVGPSIVNSELILNFFQGSTKASEFRLHTRDGHRHAAMHSVAQGRRHFGRPIAVAPTRQVGGHRSARVVAPPACGPTGSTSSEMLRDDGRDPLQVGPRPQHSQLRHVRRRGTALQHPPHAGCKDFGPDDQSAEGILPRADRRVVDARPHELDVAAAHGGRIGAELAQHPLVADPVQHCAATTIARITAPAPFLRARHQLGPYRIEVQVSADLEEIALLLDKMGLEAALE